MKLDIDLPGFKDVDDSGGSFHIEKGNYLLKLTAVEKKRAKSSDHAMIVFSFEGKEGAAAGRPFRLFCSLQPSALWKLKRSIRAFGVEPPDEPSNLKIEAGTEVVGVVSDDTYDGKLISKLTEILRPDWADPVTIVKPVAANGRGTKYIASEIQEMTVEELEEVIEENELDVDLRPHKTTIRKANAVVAALEAANLLSG